MLVRRAPLTQQMRTVLIGLALSPGDGVRNLDYFANLAKVSRTPTREALTDLSSIGLVECIPYRGFHFTFTGQDDVRRRARVLAAAVAAGKDPEGETTDDRIAHSVMGRWGEIAWCLLRAWPRHAVQWGVDLRPMAKELAEVDAEISSATTAKELGDALLRLARLY